ncbi:hypothetical protein JD844_032035 [Phrynosoma platyrhinos]|uniref:Uncharacterized protein n=1 Tax=Phrynosoma platyrhinos TaxID=52577 RepID=A0ABQ7T4R5_PHRPL|nr:hypothetical protein JD844_032035 [Phrynosoma platyrhinos]
MNWVIIVRQLCFFLESFIMRTIPWNHQWLNNHPPLRKLYQLLKQRHLYLKQILHLHLTVALLQKQLQHQHGQFRESRSLFDEIFLSPPEFSDYFTGYFNGQYWLWWIFLVLGLLLFFRGFVNYLKVRNMSESMAAAHRTRFFFLY